MLCPANFLGIVSTFISAVSPTFLTLGHDLLRNRASCGVAKSV
jgi:hypothetical protein